MVFKVQTLHHKYKDKYKYYKEKEWSEVGGSRQSDRDISAISQGPLKVQRYTGYFTKSGTIKNAQATDPQDFDNPNYNVEPVWTMLNRNAEELYLSNDEPVGGEYLFVIVSHRGVMAFSPELPIPPDQATQLLNVYEVRLRSAKKGAQYRLSEQPLKPL